jgi:aminoglycoside phosphotransferase (APT) family kinase protein
VAARRALGALMADLHRVTAPAFGYPAEESGMRADDWRTAFTTMVEGLLADAARTGTPVPAARIRAAVRAHGAALDAVVSPVVVHTDLWPANVFLDDHETIVGLIDTERTVWGDPLLDLVGADQLGLWDVDPDLLAGDTAAGGGLSAALASPAGPTRFALCRLYFSLILVTEIDVRGYDEGWVPEHRRRVAALLDAALARLGA